MEAILREAQAKAQQDSKRINALPSAKHMMTILAQRKSYVEV